MEEQDSTQNLVQEKTRRTRKYIHLIVYEKGVQSFYYSKCLVKVDRHSITVTPEDPDAPVLRRQLEQNFLQDKNIIVFFSQIVNFALVFDYQRHSDKVFKVLRKQRVRGLSKPLPARAFERRFVTPMINELKHFATMEFKFRVTILKVLKYLDVETKTRLIPKILASNLPHCLLKRVLRDVDWERSSTGRSTKSKRHVPAKNSHVQWHQKPTSSEVTIMSTNRELPVQEEFFHAFDESNTVTANSSIPQIEMKIIFPEDEQRANRELKYEYELLDIKADRSAFIQPSEACSSPVQMEIIFTEDEEQSLTDVKDSLTSTTSMSSPQQQNPH